MAWKKSSPLEIQVGYADGTPDGDVGIATYFTYTELVSFADQIVTLGHNPDDIPRQFIFGSVNANSQYANITGTKLRDVLIGGAGAETLVGGEASDEIWGGANGDSLFGDDGNGTPVSPSKSGSDSLYGEAGNDTLFGGYGRDFAAW